MSGLYALNVIRISFNSFSLSKIYSNEPPQLEPAPAVQPKQ